MTFLAREPHNMYDRFAIRVDNIYNEKVGHIPATIVKHISPLVDTNRFLFEGSVPYGRNNKFQMPLIIDIYGNESDRAALERGCILESCPLSSSATVKFAAVPCPIKI
jgi:SWI/SNF-related matrix-associated actin-dependent regulator of chromatin subfamily A3